MAVRRVSGGTARASTDFLAPDDYMAEAAKKAIGSRHGAQGLTTSAIGHGYATETVQLLTRLAFDRFEANRVEIRMDIRNTRSRGIPVRLGFVFEGCMRRALPDIHSQPGDIDVFALIREDYERLPWRTPI